MILQIDGREQTFIPIREFRAHHDLPETFSLSLFQSREWKGPGSIDRAGNALNTVRERVIAHIPQQIQAIEWTMAVPQLASQFKSELETINSSIGLRDEEIDYAVYGFEAVCEAVAFAIIRAQITQSTVPRFAQIYQAWLYGTVSMGGVEYAHKHNDETWMIRIVLHAYGRIGMAVRTPHTTHYVVDRTLACPAEGYMFGLLEAVATRMFSATV